MFSQDCEYYKKILNDHEIELRRIHNVFNQEIKELKKLKEIQDMKMNNLEMELNEKEMKEYVLKCILIKHYFITTK